VECEIHRRRLEIGRTPLKVAGPWVSAVTRAAPAALAVILAVAGGPAAAQRLPGPAPAVQSRATFDPAFAAWGRVLARCAGPRGFDYARLLQDRSDLDRALTELGGVRPGEFEAFPRALQMAFLVNAHNACAVHRVARRFPIRSIQDTARFGSALDQDDIFLLDRRWSLDRLRREILGERFRDARALFLLNWGMRGCPTLADIPVTAANLEEMLERQTRAFVRDSQRNRYERQGRRFLASPLLGDYRKELERDFTTLWSFLKRYLPPEAAEPFARRPPRIEFLNLDETLNDAPTPKEG